MNKNIILTDRLLKWHNGESHVRRYLLLTGTIDAGIYNNIGNLITDVQTRLEQYESSIRKYITETVFTDIVFIENSNYKFNEQKFSELAREYHKRFEFIQGKVCVEEITKYGKSFGDAYLIYEALQKSKLLEQCECFYKITGRIFLKNSKQICKTTNKYRNEFIVYSGLGWCLTNIFKANKEDYLKYLGDVWKECNESTVDDIEISFYRRLSASKMKIDSFETYPYFEGVMGATLRNYSGDFFEMNIRNILARLHCFSYGSKSSLILKIMFKLTGRKSYIK